MADQTQNAETSQAVWNDIPPLPGDTGYMPAPSSSARIGFSDEATRELQNSIESQMNQILEDVKKQAEVIAEQASAPSRQPGQFPAQITIDLDPNSADFGRPVFHYGSNIPQKRSMHGIDVQQAQRPSTNEAVDVVKTPSAIAAAVARRIAEAGNGAPSELSLQKPASGSATALFDQSAGGSTEGHSDPQSMPVDPALVGISPCKETQDVDNATTTNDEAFDALASPTSQYSANTARPMTAVKGDTLGEEDAALLLEAKAKRKMTWSEIKDAFFPDRSLYSLQYYYYTYLRAEDHCGFTDQDDFLLFELKETENLSWEAIRRKYFPEWKISQLQHRYYSKLSTANRVPWTKEDDDSLIRLRDEQSLSWPEIHQDHFPGRTVGQVQYRYYKHLRPSNWKERLVELAEAEHEERAKHRKDILSGAIRRRPRKHWSKEESTEEAPSMLNNYNKRLAASSLKLNEAKRARYAVQRREKAEEEERCREGRRVAKEARKTRRVAQTYRSGQDSEARVPESVKRSEGYTHPIAEAAQPIPVTPLARRSDTLGLSSAQRQADTPGLRQRSIQQQVQDALARYMDYNEPEPGPVPSTKGWLLEDSPSVDQPTVLRSSPSSRSGHTTGTETPVVIGMQQHQMLGGRAGTQTLPPLGRFPSPRGLPTAASTVVMPVPDHGQVSHSPVTALDNKPYPGMALGRLLLPRAVISMDLKRPLLPASRSTSPASTVVRRQASLKALKNHSEESMPHAPSPYVSPYPCRLPNKAAWAKRMSAKFSKPTDHTTPSSVGGERFCTPLSALETASVISSNATRHSRETTVSVDERSPRNISLDTFKTVAPLQQAAEIIVSSQTTQTNKSISPLEVPSKAERKKAEMDEMMDEVAADDHSGNPILSKDGLKSPCRCEPHSTVEQHITATTPSIRTIRQPEQENPPQSKSSCSKPPMASFPIGRHASRLQKSKPPPLSPFSRAVNSAPLRGSASLILKRSSARFVGDSEDEDSDATEACDSDLLETDSEPEEKVPVVRRRSTTIRSKGSLDAPSPSQSASFIVPDSDDDSSLRAGSSFTEDSVEELTMSQVLVKNNGKRAEQSVRRTPIRSLVATPATSNGSSADRSSRMKKVATVLSRPRMKALTVDDNSEDELAL